MASDNDIIIKALKERKIELELKNYLYLLKKKIGEEKACLVLSKMKKPSESIKFYSESFPDISDTDIVLALIKAGVLSSEDSFGNLLVKKYVSEGNIKDIMNIVYSNLYIRRNLTRTLIHMSGVTNYEYYKNKKDDDNSIGNLLTVLVFQESLGKKKQEKEKKM